MPDPGGRPPPLGRGTVRSFLHKKGQVFCPDAASDRAIWERDIAEDPGAKTPDRGDLVCLDLRR